MSDNSEKMYPEYSKFLNERGYRPNDDIGWDVWQRRQPEIDALQSRNKQLSESERLLQETEAELNEIKNERAKMRARIAELEASRGVVVLPERRIVPNAPDYDDVDIYKAVSFNSALAQVEVLNATTITAAELEGLRHVVAEIKPHISAWRAALWAAKQAALKEPPDCDDKAYWQHEINALDKIDAAMAGQDAAGGE